MADEQHTQSQTGVKLLTVFIILAVIFTFLTAYTKYIFAKDYSFYIEGPCDPETMICFIRDCDDYCPPNGLAEYRSYMIPASVFPVCTDNACSNICQNKATNHQCQEISCDTEAGDSCSDTDA